jgi:hypothetical protein
MPPTKWFGRNWNTSCRSNWVPNARAFPRRLRFRYLIFAKAAMKQSDAYKIAVARAKLTGVFIDAIGSPITQRGIISGNTNVKWSGRRSESLHSAERAKR